MDNTALVPRGEGAGGWGKGQACGEAHCGRSRCHCGLTPGVPRPPELLLLCWSSGEAASYQLLSHIFVNHPLQSETRAECGTRNTTGTLRDPWEPTTKGPQGWGRESLSRAPAGACHPTHSLCPARKPAPLLSEGKHLSERQVGVWV